MARIAGATIPQDKRIVVSLTTVYGIGPHISQDILKATEIDPNRRTKDLSEDELNKLRDEIKKYKVEGDLRQDVFMNIKRLKEISSYRGTRHSKRLPVRGQRSKTNSRTVRGNTRKTMGSGRRGAAQKT